MSRCALTHLTLPKKSLWLALGLIASLWLARGSIAADAFSQLSDFGPVKTPAEIQATFDKAVAALNETGDVLCLNPAESEVLRVENTYQGTFRKPTPPAPSKQWGAKPGFTIVEVGSKNTTINVPAQTGLQINRTLRMGPDDSLGHRTTDFPINIDNRIVSGSNSYLDWLAAPVAKGKAARFYVRTIRGIRPGQILNVHGGPGYGDRWYEITGVTVNADGTKDLTLRRYWWGVKNAASPTLYRIENGTWDGHERPLQYAIAPGTYVNDVAKAVPAPDFKTSPDLGIVPYVDAKTSHDFAPGDEIEQAIGLDPFKPTPFRMWVWDSVPGVFSSPILDLANHGSVSRYAAMAVRGDTDNADQLSTHVEQKPAWDNVITVESAAQVGLNLRADFTDAAILFQQPYREQPIKWYYRPSTNAPRKETTLTVSRDTGQLQFTGSARFAGLSGDAVPARNLRGKNVSVAAGQTSVIVTFPTAEADGDYALFVEQSWISNRAVVKKEAADFTVQFEKPAPDNAHLDWMIVR